MFVVVFGVFFATYNELSFNIIGFLAVMSSTFFASFARRPPVEVQATPWAALGSHGEVCSLPCIATSSDHSLLALHL